MSDQPTEPSPQPLPRHRLVRRCDLSALAFETTEELADLDLMVAQKRAGEAIAFGAEVAAPGFNLFVVSAAADSTDEAVRALLEQRAASAPLPNDWVYVNNFTAPDQPVAVALPAGRGPAFRDAMRGLVEDLKVGDPGGFRERGLPGPPSGHRAGLQATSRRRPSRPCRTRPPRPASRSSARRSVSPWSRPRTARCCGPRLSRPARRRTGDLQKAMQELQGKLGGHAPRRSRRGTRNAATEPAGAQPRDRAERRRSSDRGTAEPLRGPAEDPGASRRRCDADLVENVGAVRRAPARRAGPEGDGEGASAGPLRPLRGQRAGHASEAATAPRSSRSCTRRSRNLHRPDRAHRAPGRAGHRLHA